MFNQQEIALYAGVGAFTIKSFGLSKEQLITNGYSEKFAEYFSSEEATIRQGESEIEGYRLIAIMENEECGEMILRFDLADKDLPISQNNNYKFIGDTLETAWADSVEKLQTIAQEHPSDYYRGVCNRVATNNPHVARVGEEKYYNFLMAIAHPRVYDKDKNNLIPEFVKVLKEKGFDFDTVAKGDFSKLGELVAFLNGRTQGKTTVDHVAIPVVISTSNSGKQNMRFEEGYNGDNFSRCNGTVSAQNVQSFSKYIKEREERSPYNHFYLTEPLRKVSVEELMSGGSQEAVEDTVADVDIRDMI